MYPCELDDYLQQLNIGNIDDNRYSYIFTAYPSNHVLKRKDAAKIIHGFMKFILGIPDITDEAELKKASVLKDLLDCPRCVNDIRQVYLRGIMEPKYILKRGDSEEMVVIFGNEDEFSENEFALRKIVD